MNKEQYEEYCEKFRGSNNGMYGKRGPASKERIEKMVATRKRLGIGVGENNPMYKSGERGIHPLLGSKRSEETKNKISNSLKGNIPWNKGTAKIKTEEEKAEIKLKRYLENRHVTPIKVVNLNSNEEMYFSSKKECEDFFGFSIRYRLKVGKLKDENLTFERITTKEYVDKKELMTNVTSLENQLL